jgi:spermidine/putrescine transport system substrate-binding protein
VNRCPTPSPRTPGCPAQDRPTVGRPLRTAAAGAVALAAVAALAAPAAAGPVDSGADASGPPDLTGVELVISNWDGYTPPEVLAEFEAATGATVELTLHASNEEIVTDLLEHGGEGYDVVFVSAQFAQQLDEAGLLAPIDPVLIPNLDHLAPEALELASDPGLTSSVPYTWGTTGLCYRSDLVSEAPDSWMDLLAPSQELAGRVTMMLTDRWLLLPAQKALGYSLNTTDPDELEAVAELLISAKDTLLAYDDTTFYSRLVSGEALLVEAWDGWCNFGIAENSDIEFVVPTEGSDLWVDTMVILNSSDNIAAAHAFIDWVLEPAHHAQVAELVYYKVPNPAAMELVEPTLLESFPTMTMTPEELLAQEQLLNVGEASLHYADIVAQVISS